MPSGGGDACCGGGGPATPQSVVKGLIPKLNDTLFEVLADDPFKGQNTLTYAGGVPFSFRGEALLTSICADAREILGHKNQQRRKITFELKVDGVASSEPAKVGDLLTVNVTAEKLAFLKDSKHRAFMALVNQTTEQVAVDEVSATEKTINKKFLHKLTQKGKNQLRVYVFSGDGLFDSSFSKEIQVA